MMQVPGREGVSKTVQSMHRDTILDRAVAISGKHGLTVVRDATGPPCKIAVPGAVSSSDIKSEN